MTKKNLKGNSTCNLCIALGCGLLAVTGVNAETVHYQGQPVGNKVTINGTSTIHDWDMESTLVGGAIDADAGFPASALKDASAAKPKVDITIPVRGFKSYMKSMDDTMQKTMKMDKFSSIKYHLQELKPKSPAGATGALQFDAIGVLTIAGVDRTNTMPVTIEKTDKSQIKVTGTTPLKMTDFGVVPPAPNIMGMSPIKAGDDIKITFEWVSSPAPKAP